MMDLGSDTSGLVAASYSVEQPLESDSLQAQNSNKFSELLMPSISQCSELESLGGNKHSEANLGPKLFIVRWKGKLDATKLRTTTDYFILVQKVRGARVRRLDKKTRTIPNRAVSLITPGNSVVWQSDDVCQKVLFYICAKETNTFLEAVSERVEGQPSIVEMNGIFDDALALLAESCSAHFEGSNNSCHLEQETWLKVLINSILRVQSNGQTCEAEDVKPTLPQRVISEIEQFVDENVHENLTLGSLSERFGYKPEYFCKLFRSAFQVPPYQYVIQTRVQKAQILLSDEEHTLAEIAYTLGFSSQSHLNYTFKKHTGLTPGEFRRQITSCHHAS